MSIIIFVANGPNHAEVALGTEEAGIIFEALWMQPLMYESTWGDWLGECHATTLSLLCKTRLRAGVQDDKLRTKILELKTMADAFPNYMIQWG